MQTTHLKNTAEAWIIRGFLQIQKKNSLPAILCDTTDAPTSASRATFPGVGEEVRSDCRLSFRVSFRLASTARDDRSTPPCMT